MKKQINNTYQRAIATYRTLLYCTLGVSLFLNYMTLYGKLDMVGYLKPDTVTVKPQQASIPTITDIETTQPVVLSSDVQEWANKPFNKTKKK